MFGNPLSKLGDLPQCYEKSIAVMRKSELTALAVWHDGSKGAIVLYP